MNKSIIIANSSLEAYRAMGKFALNNMVRVFMMDSEYNCVYDGVFTKQDKRSIELILDAAVKSGCTHMFIVRGKKHVIPSMRELQWQERLSIMLRRHAFKLRDVLNVNKREYFSYHDCKSTKVETDWAEDDPIK